MNDADLDSLSWALVGAAGTDKWDHVRDVVASIFAARGADRRSIERRLDATWNRLTEGRRDDGGRADGGLFDLTFSVRLREVEHWRTRFTDLLDDHPEAADDLQALLDEIRPASRAGGGSGGIVHDDDGDLDYDDLEADDLDDHHALAAPPRLLEDRFVIPDLVINDPVSRAIEAAVKPGLLAFKAPEKMTQGRKERVEVAIASSVELRAALTTILQGPTEIEEIPASPFMEVELRGDTFKIAPISKSNQIVAPTALWQYDVWPLQAGLHTLTLSVSLSLENVVPGAPPGSRISVPAVERPIRVRVNIGYGTRSFLGSNWQWLVGTGIGAGGTAAAFLTVVH